MPVICSQVLVDDSRLSGGKEAFSAGPLGRIRQSHEQQVPFDFAQGRLSTTLRSGRDDNSVAQRELPGEIIDFKNELSSRPEV
jgi:hypothetical protein